MAKPSRALTLLAAALDAPLDSGRSLPDMNTMRDLLALAARQGDILQARILLTAAPGGRRYLSLLPTPAWFDECWPGQDWPLTPPRADDDAPFFSVVTPSFNQGVFLKNTIAGVMRQGFASYEHIIMDGGSTDETLELLHAHPHLRWTSEADRGQTHALNKALALARGEVIAWINSDDFYLPGAFHAVHEFFTRHPAESVLTGDCLWGWEGSGRLRYIPGEERDFEGLIRQWNSHVPGPQPSIFFRRRVLEQTGPGDESMHYGMDYDLWLRMALAGHVRRHQEIPLAFYRFHGRSKSGEQQDWTAFYNDWQTCFTRYRGHSRVLPRQRMLGVAYPLRAGADARERAALCGAVTQCARWKLRDMEVILVTDMEGAKDVCLPAHADTPDIRRLLPGLPPLGLPLRIARTAAMDGPAFARAAVTAAQTFALCMPPISSQVPYEQWYVAPLNALVDAPEMTCAPLQLRRGRLAGHPLLPPHGPLNCLGMHRRSALASALGLTVDAD